MTALHAPNIRIKLSLGFGIAFVLVIAIGLASVALLQSVDRHAREIRDVWMPKLATVEEIKRLVLQNNMLATRRIQTRNFRELADVARRMAETAAGVRNAQQRYGGMIGSDEERAVFAGHLASWQNYERALASVFERMETQVVAPALEEYDAALVAAFQEEAEAIDRLLAFLKGKTEEAVARANAVYAASLRLTVLLVACAMIALVVAVVWVTRNVSDPIRRISSAMHRLTAGDETATLAVDRERRDEIGDLVAAFTAYRDSIVTRRRLAEEAMLERERLQAALSNMPVGLTMFDADDRLIVCNGRYREMYGLPAELATTGAPLREMLEHRVKSGLYSTDRPERYVDDFIRRIGRRESYVDLIELADGRAISITAQPMPSGGWISVHEDVTARQKVEARVAHMARHDALTDLPNRVLFRERLEAALAQMEDGASAAILCLDLDQFKSVNDTLGHPVGDELLRGVAARLREAVRECDTVARLGGDEFAIVQIGEEQPVGSTALAERIIAALAIPFDVSGHQVVSGTSIGVAIAPADARDADQLLKSADMALYRAKHDGRGTYRFFEPEMDARMQERRALEIDLRQALALGQFELHYQPLLDLSSDEITGMEALVRWRHPERGIIPPGQFIPLAEEIGLIVPLGEWVIRQACDDAATWPRPVRVAVNLSPAQFKSSNLLPTVVTALGSSGLSPRRLELEITESVLLNDNEATLAILNQLHVIGVRIIMDDFGTGYSSLSYLRSFPFDKIKIDRSFINGMSGDDNSIAIVRAVVGLGTSLGMDTTAEGVETDEQLDRVRKEGCTEVQGFLISRPQPASEVARLLGGDRNRAVGAA